MKRLFQSLPSDWVYQLISLSMITTSAFYIFQFTDEYEVVREFWGLNEKFYIYTFLTLQFVVKALFYWLLFNLLRKLLFGKIKTKVIGELNAPKTKEDLRVIVEIKQFLVQVFGIPLEHGFIDREDLNEKIEMTEDELDGVMKNMVKWLCVFIHLALTSMLIWKMSAYYIIPLFIFVLVIILLFWYGITFIFGNVRLIEKMRGEVLAKTKLESIGGADLSQIE